MIRKIKELMMNTTIRQKLTFLLAVFVLYPVIVVSFFGYFKYAKDIKNEILHSLEQRIEQVNGLTAERFEQTRRFAMMIPYDGTLNDLYRKRKNNEISEYTLNRDITNYLYSKFYSKQGIDAVSFFFSDSSRIVYMVHSDNSYNRYINDIHPLVKQVADKLDGQFGYYISDAGEIYVIRKMFDRFSFKQYGNIIIKVNKEYMLDYFKDDFQNGSGLILTYNGANIFETGLLPEQDRAEIMRRICDKNFYDMNDTLFGSKPYEVITGKIELDNIAFHYGVIMPTSVVMGRYYDALKLLVILTAIVTILMVLAAILLSKAIWSPVKELLGLMKLLEKGKLGVQYKKKRNDEFKLIFDSFNKMSHEIKYLFDVAYKEELARKEAQLSSLQAQINPHFLNNTLEIMNWKARICGNTEISEIIEALGMLLDASMNRGGKSISKIADELKLVDSYMFIMKKRFGKNLEFVRDIDESLLNATIPRLLIQPLLENAVIHGLEPQGGGCLKLSVKLVEKRLTVVVEDNGAGISDEDLEEFKKLLAGKASKLESSTGIGVRNVQYRIRILYGEEYGLCLEKRIGGGTRAFFRIPYIV